ncbi:MAG: nicotinate (nicotinamide) nucleotide adenylyltransferase [Candidatus Dormibacteria bacterium]
MSSALVFGGTFDPVHNGHLAIARQARLATGVNSVWFVPAALAPLRDPPHATPEQRFELLVAARDDGREVGMEVLDVALRLGGISYTAGVMEALRTEHPGVEVIVLIGADAARTINRWHRADDLLSAERFVIVNRTGTPPLHPEEMRRLGYETSRTTLLAVDSPDISASEVRARCARGDSLAGLVPEAVAALIERKGMYRENRDDA